MTIRQITTLSLEDDAVTIAKIDGSEGTSGQVITTDGTNTSWGSAGDDWTTDLGSTNIHQNNYTDWTTDLGSTNIHQNNYTDTNTTYVSSDFDHNLLTNYTEAKHIDWAISQGSLGSKIHSSNLESIVLTTVQTAATQAAHLALSTEEGDVVVRSDENKSYIHNSGTAGTMSDFTLLATPTDAVLSVNGETGVVVTSTFASGTQMVFFQSAAPTGWTQITSHNDKALRVVSSAGGGSGGTNNFSTTHTHSHGHSLTGSAHTLTTSQIPSHQHYYAGGEYSGSYDYGINMSVNNLGDTTTARSKIFDTSDTGGGGSHTHTVSGAVSSTSISAYKYIDVIVCSKD